MFIPYDASLELHFSGIILFFLLRSNFLVNYGGMEVRHGFLIVCQVAKVSFFFLPVPFLGQSSTIQVVLLFLEFLSLPILFKKVLSKLAICINDYRLAKVHLVVIWSQPCWNCLGAWSFHSSCLLWWQTLDYLRPYHELKFLRVSMISRQASDPRNSLLVLVVWSSWIVDIIAQAIDRLTNLLHHVMLAETCTLPLVFNFHFHVVVFTSSSSVVLSLRSFGRPFFLISVNVIVKDMFCEILHLLLRLHVRSSQWRLLTWGNSTNVGTRSKTRQLRPRIVWVFCSRDSFDSQKHWLDNETATWVMWTSISS